LKQYNDYDVLPLALNFVTYSVNLWRRDIYNGRSRS
jgi:hypothetical protein